MAKYKTLKVAEIIDELDDITKIRLEDGSKAYNFPQITGDIQIGDELVVNTTAVDLNLGTGGWHFVVWNTKNDSLETDRGGHIMKMRYTPMQLDVGVSEEFEDYPKEENISGLKVIAAPLHSQVAPIVLCLKNQNADIKIAVLISDGAALPLSLSDNLRLLKDKNLVDSTISFGHAFGGDIEAINIYTALLSAKHVANADIAIVSMGPGIVGTNTQYGFTGIEVAYHLDSAKNLEANTFGVLRCSQADPRQRHRGISHHSITTFSKATSRSHNLGYISDHELSNEIENQLQEADIFNKHSIKALKSIGIVDLMEQNDIHIKSMGRTAREDELFFESAAVAARLALES